MCSKIKQHFKSRQRIIWSRSRERGECAGAFEYNLTDVCRGFAYMDDGGKVAVSTERIADRDEFDAVGWRDAYLDAELVVGDADKARVYPCIASHFQIEPKHMVVVRRRTRVGDGT